MSLKGHKALVTGASRGLGKAISHELASRGCSVSLLARNKELLAQTLEELPIIEPQQSHLAIDFDLSQINSNPLDSRIADSLNGLSVLVNCAGVSNHVLLPRLMNKYIEQTIGLNLIAPIILSKHAYRPMVKTSKTLLKNSDGPKSPIILNISSVLSLTDHSVSGTSVYAASKAGLLGFTTSLAAELKGKVRVNALLPGLIKETDMGASATIQGDFGIVKLEKVVQEVLRIIEDDTINGECTVVDDGHSRLLK